MEGKGRWIVLFPFLFSSNYNTDDFKTPARDETYVMLVDISILIEPKNVFNKVYWNHINFGHREDSGGQSPIIKPDNLSSISWTYMVFRAHLTSTSCPWGSTCAPPQ